ncbi:hypothetical protein VKT23_017383 [Stygiomarasmius scandens]|uniref:F-box domain-containing protein n=1 Tax=Marasmiellus scandens TaxID=2682957 RepID=A0ABR1IS69_9AGAR
MDIPSNTDITRIIPVLDECQTDLDHYSEEIEKLSETLATLKRKKDELQAYRDHQASFVSPVRRLPAEVLMEIFTLCCSTGLTIKGFKDKVSAPTLFLSQTCSFWHRVTLSTPALWSNLSINLCEFKPNNGTRLHNLLKLYLNRSIEGPGLSFEVSAYEEYQHTERLDTEGWAAFGTLLRARDIWTRASFNLPWILYSDVFERLDGFHLWKRGAHLPNLKHLSIKWPKEYIDSEFGSEELFFATPPSPPFFEVLMHASALQSFYLDELRNHSGFECLPLHHAKELSVSEIGQFSDLLWLLTRCAKNCVKIKFSTPALDIEEPEDFSAGSLPEIVFPDLHFLKYSFEHSDFHVPKILSTLTLPSLTTLELGLNRHVLHQQPPDWRQAMFRDLMNMLDRSGCSLKNLSIVGRLFETDREWIKIFSATPSVENLTIDVGQWHKAVLTGELFEALSFNCVPDQYIVLPNLKMLRLSFEEDFFQNLGLSGTKPSRLPNEMDIFSMIKSRRTADGMQIRRLQCFTLDCKVTTVAAHRWVQNFDSDVEPGLGALKKGGLRLSLKTR